ncbi:MAG: division/cell wall cluster transcriptional repressor MraZ [Bacteroidales bacterium]|nr:division/cell wall cluster transcriptional repressor MraZ [Bacteroidales bacterium]
MITLTYTYECKADAKGRIMLPAGLKKELAAVLNEGFVIKRSVFYKCLEVYPKSEWNKDLAMINKLNRYKKDNQDFMYGYMAGIKPIDVDNSGRIQIPKNLIEAAKIKKEVVLAGQINKLAIWNKEEYEKVISEKTADFQALTEKVMGNIDNNDE